MAQVAECGSTRCLTRFKNATSIYPALVPLVEKLGDWVRVWAEKICANPPQCDGDLEGSKREFMISHLQEKATRLTAIIERERNKATRHSHAPSSPTVRHSSEGLLSALETHFQDSLPGILRPAGPRHDNDHADINDIRIAPTEQELISTEAPYLPANFYDAPHHLGRDNMERLLDTQFRLLREELLWVIMSKSILQPLTPL